MTDYLINRIVTQLRFFACWSYIADDMYNKVCLDNLFHIHPFREQCEKWEILTVLPSIHKTCKNHDQIPGFRLITQICQRQYLINLVCFTTQCISRSASFSVYNIVNDVGLCWVYFRLSGFYWIGFFGFRFFNIISLGDK